MAVIDFFDRGWRMNPTAVAYRGEDEEWTYDQAYRNSCQVAHALMGAGVVKQTKVAVLSPNSIRAWLCVLGIWRAGAAWVPLNPASPAADNAALVERFDVEVLLYHPKLAEAAVHIRQTIGRPLTCLSFADSDSWLDGQPDTPPAVSYHMDDVVSVTATGGTTGQPKGVMNTHRSFGVMVAHQILAMSYAEGERAVNLAAAPLTHSAGALTLQATARGGSVVIIPKASPEGVLDAVERYGVTEVFLPPTVIYRLLDELETRPVDTSSLRYLLYGAAPMSLEKLREGIRRLGPVFLEVYGQTEAPAAISFMRPSEHLADGDIASDERLGSCGRPYPLVSVAIKDVHTAEPVAHGASGEICVGGDLLMKGYYKDPEQTAATIRDGWLHTGDIGHLDAEGYLHITDRKKDMIISGGFNVYPSEVEQVIWGHPAVADCAVVGAPDAEWGERVTAVVELKSGLEVTVEEIKQRCRDALGPIRSPKEVLFVPQLPRSVNGKVLRKDVRAQFWVDRTRAL
ncbi:class I adenylate-forming enzyme family protein [Streptomyces sp. NPDC056390]|uniref:class I adenylate-forming enzyme family protein n=1 Tax=Streptomyces sp. NPDC056390 TaxID=3345806 RepID=UPI0035D60925